LRGCAPKKMKIFVHDDKGNNFEEKSGGYDEAK